MVERLEHRPDRRVVREGRKSDPVRQNERVKTGLQEGGQHVVELFMPRFATTRCEPYEKTPASGCFVRKKCHKIGVLQQLRERLALLDRQTGLLRRARQTLVLLLHGHFTERPVREVRPV